MEISKLEVVKDNFYVPTYVLKVHGQDVLRELFMAVTSIDVDLKQNAAGHFSFTIENAFDWKNREFVAKKDNERIDLLELFEFGAPIEIAFGYGDPSKLSNNLIRGVVTEISTNFSEGSAPGLTVSGYDRLFPLTIGKTKRNWENVPDSKAVSDIANEKGLIADVVQTTPIKPRIDQNQESDIAFMEKLAKRNSAIFYVRDDRLYFGPRNCERTSILKLFWGKGLLSFSPEVNLAKQITAVEVTGNSADSGEHITGRAVRGDETCSDNKRKPGAERIAQALEGESVMQVRAAVHTQKEADERARAILEERGQDLVKGNGESIGLPEIVPDVNIELAGLGNAFSKTYYVNESTHKIDGSGYRSTFKVEGISI